MRLQRPHNPAVQPAAAVLIAAVNLLALSALLFFFLSTSAKPGYGIETALVPLQPGFSGHAVVETIEIVVPDGAGVLVNGSRISIAELERLLGQLSGKGERTYMIVAASGVAFEQVSRVWDICRQSGARQVYVALGKRGGE